MYRLTYKAAGALERLRHWHSERKSRRRDPGQTSWPCLTCRWRYSHGPPSLATPPQPPSLFLSPFLTSTQTHTHIHTYSQLELSQHSYTNFTVLSPSLPLSLPPSSSSHLPVLYGCLNTSNGWPEGTVNCFIIRLSRTGSTWKRASDPATKTSCCILPKTSDLR